MKKIISLCLVGVLLPLAGQAQQRPVLVELFTSQGCSSCPAADRMLSELSLDKDILALSFHVDYWDYIGWKDTFASERFTRRQYAYARAGGRDMVYTPQMIINGTIDAVGNRHADVQAAVDDRTRQSPRVRLRAEMAGHEVHIRAEPLAGPVTPAEVQLVRFQPRAEVAVRYGENAGKMLDYVNIVREIGTVANWDGTAPLDIRVPAPGDLPAAVIMQAGGMGEVLSAALAEAAR